MTGNTSIIRQFISNIEVFSFPISNKTVIHFRNITNKLIVRLYRKNHLLIDEKEITNDGTYSLFDNLKRKGIYLIEILDEAGRFERQFYLS